jgi:hypothetical protein
MRVAFVAGFFDPVKRMLEERFAAQMGRGSVIWIPQARGGEAKLSEFASRFNSAAAQGHGPILILLAVLRSREFVRGHAERITQCRAGLDCQLVTFENAADRDGVAARLEEFCVPDATQIDAAAVRAKVPNGKVLCVSLAGKASIHSALCREGFSGSALEECFEFEIVPGARNSSLIGNLQTRAARYSGLLYAWDGLRTLQPEVKRAFPQPSIEGRTAQKVVASFVQWLGEQ